MRSPDFQYDSTKRADIVMRVGDIDEGNYLEIESDGMLEFKGDATVWDDQQVILGVIKKGVSAPTDTAYKNSQVLAFNKAQDNKGDFTAQLTHKYKLGTNLHFHIHMTVPDDTAGVVRWIFTYSWADIGNDFPAITTVTVNQTISAGSQDKHFYYELSDNITSTSAESDVSGLLLCSLTREGTHIADTYDNDAYLVAADFHVQMDTVGSRQEIVK